MTDVELVKIASDAERYNGAGRVTVLALVAEVQRLRLELVREKAKTALSRTTR